MTATLTEGVAEVARRARQAARSLRGAQTTSKNEALRRIAAILRSETARIVEANAQDVAREQGRLSSGMIDRLLLNAERIEGIARAVEHVVGLADPVGEVVRGSRLANGMYLRQVRVPMGVIGMIYEARPNVTVDAATLALKAGSAVILRGGSAAIRTNEVLVELMRQAVAEAGFPADCVQTIDAFGREGAVELMKLRGLVDLVIPRGGAGLIQTVVRESLVPVIETGVGNNHVYVDASADVERASAVVVNSKTHRPSVCNAAETLLVHADIAPDFLPRILRELHERGVTLHCDAAAQSFAGDIPTQAATEEDWEKEYLALEMAVAVVPDIEAALAHIARYSSGHTEAIVAENQRAINRFTSEVDCAAVMVNASTRFTDGGEFGLGAEIGISTQKLHARGPMGLEEMTTTTWIAEGEGHVR